MAPHGDGSPKYLWQAVCDSEHKSVYDWKQLLRYFCNSMLYKTLALLLSGDGRMVENVGQTGGAGHPVMLFMVTCTVL